MATNPQAPFPPRPGTPDAAPPASSSAPPLPSPGTAPPPSAPSAQGGVYGTAAPRPPGAQPPAPPSPAVPPAAPTPAAPRSGLLVVTLIVAALALILGLAGVVISAIALGQADKATKTAAANNVPTAAGPATEAPQPADPAADPTTDAPADPGVTTSPGEINPTAEFAVKYQDEKLRVQSERCSPGYRTGIDLDEPRVLKEGEGDITYGGCLPGTIETDLPIAEIPGQDATPADCLENIRTAPGRSPVAPSEGLTLCFLTSQNEAAAQGISQKLVFVTVDSITKDNDHGVLNITLKAWDVPE